MTFQSNKENEAPLHYNLKTELCVFIIYKGKHGISLKSITLWSGMKYKTVFVGISPTLTWNCLPTEINLCFNHLQAFGMRDWHHLTIVTSTTGIAYFFFFR